MKTKTLVVDATGYDAVEIVTTDGAKVKNVTGAIAHEEPRRQQLSMMYSQRMYEALGDYVNRRPDDMSLSKDEASVLAKSIEMYRTKSDAAEYALRNGVNKFKLAAHLSLSMPNINRIIRQRILS